MCRQVRELLGGRTLFGLVNNAGVAFHGPLMHQPISEFARNIEINLTGTLIVTQVKHCHGPTNMPLMCPLTFMRSGCARAKDAPQLSLQLSYLCACGSNQCHCAYESVLTRRGAEDGETDHVVIPQVDPLFSQMHY